MHVEKQLAFSCDEFERRLTEVRDAAAARGLDALLLFSPSNVYYLCGFFSVNLWDFQCLIVPLSSDPVLVIREFETGRFHASCMLREPWTYPPEGAGPPAVIKVLRQLRMEEKRLGVEMSRHLDANAFNALRAGLSDAAFCDAADVLDAARAVKSEDEIEYMRQAAKVTGIGMNAALAAVRERGTDSEVAAAANYALLAAGSDFMCIDPIVAAGRYSGIAHSTVSGATLNPGDPVFVELGACVHRYTAPLMRTAAVGFVPGELQELADYSSRVLDAMVEWMKPGVPACEVAEAGKRALAPIESKIFFHYVWGYPVGVGFPPSWLEETRFFIQSKNRRELRPGMVFHLPLTLRVLGRYGAGFSETVLVTRTGAEILTNVPRKLRVA